MIIKQKRRQERRSVEAKLRRAARQREKQAALGSIFLNYGYSVYRRVRDRIAEDAGWRCTYCKKEVRTVSLEAGGVDLATIDHKIPLSRRGTWKRYNLACACRGCNDDKRNMTADEYRIVMALGLAWTGPMAESIDA